MKSKSTPPTRTRPGHRAETATVSIIAALIVILRFAYIPFAGQNDIEGDFLDYPWLSSFLYSAGVELSFLSFSLILAYATRFMNPGAKGPFMFLAYSIAFVAMFFISWVILPETYFTLTQEITISLISSVCSLIAAYGLGGLVSSHLAKLMGKVRYLMNLLLVESVETGLVSDIEKWDNQITDKALEKVNE